ncbi:MULTISPECIES: class IV adenylate cyclase [unclassified Wenzhouxiangella]|uniref:class IV adenylate cyclase n=1 Tax=unclassified Wenzhouxiangella TaxID=2613841 RepID=UPI000E326BEB|nr:MULTISPECIES: class IV adenylate cyclase [unclassified Wenzhouxiangella]RFF27614.1 CYTH domain-containing protein [Wenzhouxiangella sp. 15181]RFP70138.1 CYTH domain-containing protein [Wenzhouxiangella sp. 15190]
MARNIEIKARVADPGQMARRISSVAEEGPWTIKQDDTFFACKSGRLKLRDFGNGNGELIFYRRPDQAGPGHSEYRITPTEDPEGLRAVLAEALGVTGRVRKQRELYLAGRSRIHLDRVEGLGDFMELEVVLSDKESSATGEAEARFLMERLQIAKEDLVEVAYVDMLEEVPASSDNTD